MSSLAVVVKHRVKKVMFRVMRRYDLGRKQLVVFGEDWNDWNERITKLEGEVSDLTGRTDDERISNLQAQADRIAAAASNNARVIADLEDRIAEMSAALARLAPGNTLAPGRPGEVSGGAAESHE